MGYADYGIEIPQGKTSGEVATTCPKCSSSRKPENQKIKCLGVNLDKNCWRCNHCLWEGGLPPDKPTDYSNPPKTYKKPVWRNNLTLSDKLVRWFEGRRISQKTMQFLKVTEGMAYIPQLSKEVNCIHFNYFRGGELVNVKFRDSQKNFALVGGAELIFYNLDSLIGAKECYIVEGEMDLSSFIEAGIMREGVGVVSVPNGANTKTNNLQYVDNCIGLFEGIEKIHLATDNDPAGRKLREDLAERFGKERCDYIEFKDLKDANEILVRDGIQGLIECCADKKEFPLEGAFPASVFRDELKDLYHKGLDMGVGIGISEQDKLIRFVPGQLTVITGISNMGKSTWVDQMCVLLSLKHNWKIAFYSPENRPTKLHLSNIIRKLVGKSWFGVGKMSEQEMLHAMSYLEGKFWFIKPEKDFTLTTILNKAKELKKRYGIDALIIDAWNKLEHKLGKSAETHYVSEQLDLLLNHLEMMNIHCFLVAHPVKMEKDKRDPLNYVIPNLYSISGSAAFFSKADNGMCIYREYSRGHGGSISSRTKCFIQKIRFSHLGELGVTEWDYHKETGRFDIAIGGKSIPDLSNWITKENRQSKINVDELATTKIISSNPFDDPLPF